MTRAATASRLHGFGPVLFECARLLDEIAQAEVNRQAGRRLLTPSLVRLLPHLSLTGIRPTVLARRVDVTKQAVGQAVNELVAMGFAELVADPSDGRARLVRLTPAGDAAYAHGRAVLGFYADALAARVGTARVRELTEGLAAVLEVLQEWSAGDAPVHRAVSAGTLDPVPPRPRARRRGLPR